ncbi:uncharacterized protein LOC135473360 [Liolophura sinensis]|uniref:uncharacterized protein LOC135473360 n=1 Tax=Liolophura sinensis TaxID=3198878 RepID=UPI0031594EEA
MAHIPYVFSLCLGVISVGFSSANIFNSNPSTGACLCVTSSIAQVFDKGCGNAVDKAVKGQCLKYYGLRLTCGDKQYFRCDIVGKERWLEAHDLELSGASKCSKSICHSRSLFLGL